LSIASNNGEERWCFPIPSEGWGRGNSTESAETKQSDHAPRFGREVKNGSSAKDGAPERLMRAIQKEDELDPIVCPQGLEEFSFDRRVGSSDADI